MPKQRRSGLWRVIGGYTGRTIPPGRECESHASWHSRLLMIYLIDK